ncbi:hypothetical protein OH77DRAFT_638719 [Trametes cingulata]|nr:hypothetical protein OH77DRAFT_638719 [Trametes cingulata]
MVPPAPLQLAHPCSPRGRLPRPPYPVLRYSPRSLTLSLPRCRRPRTRVRLSACMPVVPGSGLTLVGASPWPASAAGPGTRRHWTSFADHSVSPLPPYRGARCVMRPAVVNPPCRRTWREGPVAICNLGGASITIHKMQKDLLRRRCGHAALRTRLGFRCILALTSRLRHTMLSYPGLYA